MENGVMYLSNYKFDSVIKRHYKCRLTKAFGYKLAGFVFTVKWIVLSGICNAACKHQAICNCRLLK